MGITQGLDYSRCSIKEGLGSFNVSRSQKETGSSRSSEPAGPLQTQHAHSRLSPASPGNLSHAPGWKLALLLPLK